MQAIPMGCLQADLLLQDCHNVSACLAACELDAIQSLQQDRPNWCHVEFNVWPVIGPAEREVVSGYAITDVCLA
jgi:hypothetical protein